MPVTQATFRSSQQALAWQTHPRYDEWASTWRLLGECLEGDGGFLDGSNLIPHPRELNYGRYADGSVNTGVVLGEKEKFRRRKQIARYDNFAAAVVETFVDYQYAKPIVREIRERPGLRHPIEDWWDDVDGAGTSMSDWMKATQVLVNTYGHAWIVLDRERADDLGGVRPRPRSRAEEGRLVLRRYLPLDTFDWTAPTPTRVTSIKFVEAIERTSVFEPVRPTPLHEDEALDRWPVRFRIWTPDTWVVLDANGDTTETGEHAFGEPPVVCFYARRRPRVPFVGRSILGDGRLFRDHFNVLSELRELMRAHTFSLLNIQLGPTEDVGAARALMGDHLGTDSILFTRGGAQWLAPPGGPVDQYMTELANIERKIYRLVGIPWEGDTYIPEAAESRRLKALDLNRLLAGHADAAELVEYALARLWFIATYGRAAGLARYADSGLVIKYPDDFHTADLIATIDTARSALSLDLGPTAATQIRRRAISVILPDLSPDMREQVEQELAERSRLIDTIAVSQLLEPETAPPSPVEGFST
jgi:hypothetical protein